MTKKSNLALLGKAIKNPIQAILALAAVVGFFTVVMIMMFRDIPPGVKDLLLTLLGTLATIVVQIYQFYFGSSKGSQDKNEIAKEKEDNLAAK